MAGTPLKYYETAFVDYLAEYDRENLHPKLTIHVPMSGKAMEVNNMIFYGPAGIGKYTQALNIISKYSPSRLKYDKRITIVCNKHDYIFRVSDVHYEIDMELLGCASKAVWNDFYNYVWESTNTKVFVTADVVGNAATARVKIILCKNFHKVSADLLGVFYSYMQQRRSNATIVFYILTDQLSFIPSNIINCCKTVHIRRPPKTCYQLIVNTKSRMTDDDKDALVADQIGNIKALHFFGSAVNGGRNNRTPVGVKSLGVYCDEVLRHMEGIATKDVADGGSGGLGSRLFAFRGLLYDCFIYDFNLEECIWYILRKIFATRAIDTMVTAAIVLETQSFFERYGGNYRPIYHLEYYFLWVARSVFSTDAT